jgi:hypothetical protein
MISWAVVGHETRIVAATELAKQLGGPLALDNGIAGATHNHLRAWELTGVLGCGWRGVLEDDAEPVENFRIQAEAALNMAPEPIVSFYLGRGRPARMQQREAHALQRADAAGAHWIIYPAMLHAVGIAMVGDYAEDAIDWITANAAKLPIDEAITAWCRARSHRVAYSVPSLVDHAQGPSLIRNRPYKTLTPRRAWRTGGRGRWNQSAVPM